MAEDLVTALEAGDLIEAFTAAIGMAVFQGDDMRRAYLAEAAEAEKKASKAVRALIPIIAARVNAGEPLQSVCQDIAKPEFYEVSRHGPWTRHPPEPGHPETDKYKIPGWTRLAKETRASGQLKRLRKTGRPRLAKGKPDPDLSGK